MFGLRFFSDSQNLRKKGQPPHHTTGVARSSSTYLEYLNCAANPSIGAIAMKSSGALSTALTQRRRVRSRSSALSSSAPATGTRAMPHLGQRSEERRVGNEGRYWWAQSKREKQTET